MKWSLIVWTGACLAWTNLGPQSVEAQQRTFGRPLQRQSGPQRLQDVAASADTAGGITGSERFLRESRRPGEFVGGDQATTRFVGSGAIIETGRVRSAVESLPPPPDPSRQINRPLAPAGVNQPYAPRLQLDFSPSSTAAPPVPQAPSLPPAQWPIDLELTRLLVRTGSESLQVQVHQRTAVVSGIAADERQRQVAELLISFQPGISQVVNEIRIGQ